MEFKKKAKNKNLFNNFTFFIEKIKLLKKISTIKKKQNLGFSPY